MDAQNEKNDRPHSPDQRYRSPGRSGEWLAAARVLPSGVNATAAIPRASRGKSCCPVATFHNSGTPSSDTAATVLQSGEKAAAHDAERRPRIVARIRKGSRSQRSRIRLWATLSSIRPSGENDTQGLPPAPAEHR